MGQRDAGRGELRSWQTMNEDREYKLPSSPNADNYVPTISPSRRRSPRGARRACASAFATAAAAAATAPKQLPATLEEVLASGCVFGGALRPRPRPRPRRTRPAQGGVDGKVEAPLAPRAALPPSRARVAATAAVLGLSFSAPAFAACAASAASAASALAASSSFDERSSRGRRPAAAEPSPQRLLRGALRGAVAFNVMAVGGTGLGKSTLLHAMFANQVFSEHFPGPCPRIKKTLQVESSQVLVEVAGLRLRLTLVDTPGIGDAVDNSKCLKPILSYIDDRNYDYLKRETDANGKARPDRRIHCCLYFIEPTGHGLKRLDIECMRKLHDRVNVIPVIAKADTLTSFECYQLKRQLIREIAEHQINIYGFPEVKAKDEQLRFLKDRLPFAIVSCNTVVEENGRMMLARRCSWGIVEIDNLENSDFCLLRKVLLQTHLHDLKEATNVHSESYRCRKLAPINFDDYKNLGGSKRKKHNLENEHVLKQF